MRKGSEMKIMNLKTQVVSILAALFIILAAMQLPAQSFVLDIEGSTFSFTNANRTLIHHKPSDPQGIDEGAIHKYTNVLTKDGIVVDAYLRILERKNATIERFDDDTQEGMPDRFQPRIIVSKNNGYILYEIEYVENYTEYSVFAFNYNLTAVDIDGDGNKIREYVEVGGYSTYTVNNPTELTITTNNQTGRTRFTGPKRVDDGIVFKDGTSMIANFQNANNKITFALGQVNSGNDARMYSVQLGVAGGVFTNEQTVPNPLPVAVDDVGAVSSDVGGIAIDNVLDNDLYDGEPIIHGDVTISIVEAPTHPGIVLNTATGQVTVTPGTPGGDYTFIYKICMNDSPDDCDVATVTVKVVAADLLVIKSSDKDETQGGETITYTIKVTNNGPTDAFDVEVEDILPADLTVNDVAVSKGNWVSPVWAIGSLVKDDTVTMTIQATIIPDFSGNLVNTATVSSSTYDPDEDNNESSVTILVLALQGPTAVDDEATTLINTPVDINVLTNDTKGSAELDPTSVSFIPGTEPEVTEGVFSVDANTGLVTFTPADDFLGVVTIDYKVCDVNGFCAEATITVTVIAGLINHYPATGPGTLAFEDLWPGKGDYDFNDLVVDYQFEIVSNITNHVEEVNATFVLKAFGAALENGFGFQLPKTVDPAHITTVTGFDLTENYVTLDGNGTESGQSSPTFIVFDNAYAQMPHPGMGIGVNTTPEAPYVNPVTFIIHIEFQPNTVTYNALDIAAFNPFLIVDKNRGHEVHLPYYPPTDLANPTLFGQNDDASNPDEEKYYVDENNLPWAINIYESFDYPIEKQDILQVHLKFAEWATSGGVLFPDWYKDLNGYRNQSLIYQIPENE